MTSTIAVISARVVCQAVQLDDGRTIAIELANPLRQFAIVKRDGDDVEILAMREDQTVAIEEAERLVKRIETANAQGSTLQ